MKYRLVTRYAAALTAILLYFGGLSAVHGATEEELAKKLANPIAALISVPFQLNYDQNIGSHDDGERWTLNIQPVVPFDLNENWNLISRTILPVVWQDDVAHNAGSQSGIGDVVQSLFFHPRIRRMEAGCGEWARYSCCPLAPTIC